ncbi:acetate--CoA ligase [Candidatus Nitrosotenuis cloacae]|uniref:Acetate--CoA ligase n=1 Tax=Candidatus Nitrosotenuis cloacae TaxID=1603555 RepID=A0A3G1B0U7_9ARCH|nr:acetate--CoA ligase [Candidatus Nitrosotenuis cloacae]AJZ75465.1 3-hydroxypropionyl-CoA synthetase [Candidatus Nitrosotenuis cloacae]
MDSYFIGLGNNDIKTRKEASIDYVKFWESQAQKLHWFELWTIPLQWNPPFAKWFVGGKLNASYNALDVQNPAKTAIFWEGENQERRTITYGELLDQTQRLANALKSLGIKAGDRITIYLPMVPELIVSVLACARIGAIHTVIFSGFSAQSIKDRVIDSQSKIIITADGGYRRGNIVKLKDMIDSAVCDLSFVQNVIVLKRAGNPISTQSRDLFWDEIMQSASNTCPAEPLDGTHPLYILYTSGTTGKPKGVLHDTGGYLTHISATFRWAFDVKDSDVYFCSADIGWVTGHSYVAYGPLICGATQVMYEGAPDYPSPARMWDLVQRYKITILYTTPTALRMFMKFGDAIPNSHDLSSLRLLGSVGEPINPEVWKWYYTTIGKSKCPIIDTWWQTETGGMMISPLPGLETIPLKPGSGAFAIPGVDLGIVDESGNPVTPDTKGYLIIRKPWPGILTTLWGDDEKYKTVYWSKYPNSYYTGDYAVQDKDGYFWLLGRADDVLKVAGHRIGTAEIESSLVSNHSISEAAVCGIPDDIKGEVIIAFLVPKDGVSVNDSLKAAIIETIRKDIGAIATPQAIYFVSKLPKTRSGKIMRRLLKAIASNEKIGDVSTLEDGAAVSEIQIAFDDLKKQIH